jgi:homoserine O-succinyltransferase
MFYKTFDSVKDEYFDGLIITGAPVELMQFEDVAYWAELKEIMDWADDNSVPSLFICWAAQAALYHYHRIQKYELPQKLFGVFKHTVNNPLTDIAFNFDDEFWAPHSRYTEVRREDIIKIPSLEILSESEMAGVYIVMESEKKRIYVTGHSEYDAGTLGEEYQRDIAKGIDIQPPLNYFKDNDPSQQAIVRWKMHANLLFSNWIRFFVDSGYKIS